MDDEIAEKYVPSPENRKRWCQGKVGRAHAFEFWRYHPDSRSEGGDGPYFIFQCVACGRKRYCTDPEGVHEIDFSDRLDEESVAEPSPPVELVFEVQVVAVAEDGSRRRVCQHAEHYSQKFMEGVDLQALQEQLVRTAYEAFDSARNKVL